VKILPECQTAYIRVRRRVTRRLIRTQAACIIELWSQSVGSGLKLQQNEKNVQPIIFVNKHKFKGSQQFDAKYTIMAISNAIIVNVEILPIYYSL